MNRHLKNIYCFISDKAKNFYRANQVSDGTYNIVNVGKTPYPLKFNPSNLRDSPLEMATNSKYFGLFRSLSYPLDFIKDGAAICRYFLRNKKGIASDCYLTIVEWNGNTNVHELSYYGKLDLSEKSEDPKSETFTVPTIDDSAFGILSENDDTEYEIECSPSNPKCIPVLFDSITLINKATFQTVQAPIIDANVDNNHTIPFVLVNQDGDSAGLILKNQSLNGFNSTYVPPLHTGFLESNFNITGVKIQGSFTFEWSTNTLPSGGLEIYFIKNTGSFIDRYVVFSQLGGNLVPGKIYSFDIDITFDMNAGEEMYFVAQLNDNPLRLFQITPITTNIFVTTNTKAESVVRYGLRSLDLGKALVEKATKGRFTLHSEFFEINNKDIHFSGDSIRGVPNSKIYSSFYNFFKTHDALKFMCLKGINGELYMEKAIVVYQSLTPPIIDLGDIIDLQLQVAKDYYCNEVQIGSPKQDYRHPSGRLEFNSVNTFSLPFENIKKKLELITSYRLGCYDIQFLILDYQGGSSQDNNGDKSVYVAEITDEQATAVSDIETFENVTVDNATLSPIIKKPLNTDIINFDKPFVSGVGIPTNNVSIYVDSVLDGSTVVDANGNWSYNIVNGLSSYNPSIATGQHDIQATYTDLSAPFDSVSVVIDTTVACSTEIIYPQVNQSLYNNKPLIKGVAQAGTNIDVFIDSILVGSVVADNSCKWEYKIVTPLTNTTHIITVAGAQPVNIIVDSFVSFPLITYIGSELDGFVLTNNLPLIEGVAQPGTLVSIFLNYIPYSYLGQAVTDVNGNWSFQVIPINYIDPVTSFPVILAPIRNGLNVISTSLLNHTVGINVQGYKLNRPAFSSITGVPDNTVFNTSYSPQRMMRARYSLFASILKDQPGAIIEFQTADKNRQLRTVLGTDVVAEDADIQFSSLGNPLMVLEWAMIKTKTILSFAKILYALNNGSIVKGVFRGTDIYCLPIGSMKMNSVRAGIQDWKLLISPLTTAIALANLYKNGVTINLMQNTIFHSDYNSMHGVRYNFTQSPVINTASIYDTWFNFRNDFWRDNPEYIQKFQSNEVIKDQIITNGIGAVTLRCYRCIDGTPVGNVINYNVVGSQPVQPPEVVFEAEIDFSQYDFGQIFFVMYVNDTPVMIFERIEVRTKWQRTILMNSGNSKNYPGFFYSTGIRTIIRVEGIIKKIQPELVDIVAEEEDGDSEMVYSVVSQSMVARFGTSYGLPDYLYWKIANGLSNDDLKVEDFSLVLDKEDKIIASEDVEAHPLYYYNVKLRPKENTKGLVVIGEGTGEVNGVVLVVDGTAVGMPTGSLITINLD